MRARYWIGIVAFPVALVASIAAAGGGFDPNDVDGRPVGKAIDCSTYPKCQAIVDAATAALDRRDPIHLGVVRFDLHEEGQPIDSHGSPVPVVRSGTIVVVRFWLGDGTLRAIGVAPEPGGLVTVDRGP